MRSSRFLVHRVLAVLLMVPVVATAQGARGTPTPSLPTPPPPPAQQEIGPLEKRASPITPENPVPRRIHFVVPAYPSEAAGSGFVATVTLKATLDQKGAVAEARQTAVNMQRVGTASGPGSPQVLQAFRKSAVDAVRQWLYDPPISAPISLYVQLTFVPDADSTVAWHDASPPPARQNVVGGVVGGVPAGSPPPPPPPPPPPGAVRVGGNIAAPRKIKDVKPVYPAIAASARVQGVVILETIIGADGRVIDAHVLRSIPLLDQSALDAVRQWEFTPTLLNGAPTPIIMSVTVSFSLDK